MSYQGARADGPFIVERRRENGEFCGLPLPPQGAAPSVDETSIDKMHVGGDEAKGNIR